jgi:hypothetical protein
VALDIPTLLLAISLDKAAIAHWGSFAKTNKELMLL